MNPEQEQTTETPNDEQQVSTSEAQAREKGWVSKDEWVEQGKDENDWVTHRHFNERGEWINEKRSLQEKVRNFDERLANNNKVWEATLDEKIKTLQNDKKQAVKMADEDTVEKIDQQLEQAKQQKAEVQQPINAPSAEDTAHENEWLQNNASWYQTKTPKGLYAQAMVNDLVNQGYSGQQLTSEVERLVSNEFPEQNPNRDKSITDKSTPVSGKAKKISSINQLTGADANVAMSLKNAGMTDKQIIQMINDREKR